MIKLCFVFIIGSFSCFAQANEIIISLNDHKLYLIDDQQIKQFKITNGKKSTPTPQGQFKIINITKNPTWNVPLSIQRETSFQKRFGGVTSVPPGPRNPLGKYFIRLTDGGIGIHGTNNIKSIGGAYSHGCIRMYPKDVQYLASVVGVGTPVTIVDQF